MTLRVAREHQGGDQAKGDTRYERQAGSPQHHGAVDADLGLPRELHGSKPLQDIDTELCHEQAADASKDGDDEILGQELPHQPEPRRTECPSDCQLTFTSLGTGQEQVGNVDAGDEEHKPHGDAERHQRWLHVAGNDLAEWPHGQLQAAWVRRRVARDKARHQSIQLGLRLGDGGSGCETSDQRQSSIEHAGHELSRQPHVDMLLGAVRSREHEGEAGPHDAHDLHVEVIERDSPADHSRIAVESPLPQIVADDDALEDDVVRVFRGDKRSPERQRRCAEERQQVVGHPDRGDALHRAVDLETRVPSLGLGNGRYQSALRSHVEDCARRGVGARQCPRVSLDGDDAGPRPDKAAAATARRARR